jgi:hypothetical protein
LGYELIQLTVLQQLGHGADGEAKRGHGGAELEGVLDGPGGTHFVVAEANPKPAGFAVAGPTSGRARAVLP